MSFQIRNLSALAYAQGFGLWHYKAGGDRLCEVARWNYFHDAAGLVNDGDVVMVSASDGTAIRVVWRSASDSISLVPVVA